MIVVEHDLSVLDYLSDFICCLYGKPGAYGVVTLPFSVRCVTAGRMFFCRPQGCNERPAPETRHAAPLSPVYGGAHPTTRGLV